jgi:hypothetical protein
VSRDPRSDTGLIGRHLRGNVVNYVALFLALTGSAYAVVIAPTNSVATRSIKDGAVTAPKLHDSAVTTPKFAASAVVPSAASAQDAELLGGSPAEAFERVPAVVCSGDRAFASLGDIIVCKSLVSRIFFDPTFAQQAIPVGDFNETRLELSATCHLNSTTEVGFNNQGSGPAALSWMYSDGTTVSASGVAVPTGEIHRFDYAGKRLLGQFIWANSNGVTTIKLHALDNGPSNGCEVWGTAAFAATA